jgi:leucyl aminopeptidase
MYWRVGAQSKGEKLWRMPLADEYRPNIKSEIADLKNVGGRVRPSTYIYICFNTSKYNVYI